MEKMVKRILRQIPVGLILVGFFSSMLYGDLGNIKIQPYVTVQEEYNDNINLTSKNQKADFITSLFPGITFSDSKPTSGFDLDYKLGLVFYAATPDNNYIGHTGKLDTWISLDPRWTLRLRDTLLRSEESSEGLYSPAATENRPDYSFNRQRAVFLRNVLEPAVEYRFGKENRFMLAYKNNLYRTQNKLSQDSQENMIKANFAYWVNVRNGIVLDYSFSRGEFENSPTLRSQSSKVRYAYRLNPKTSFYGEYSLVRNDFDSPGINYVVHNPALGMDHAFTPALSGSAQVGYFWKNSDNGNTNGYTYQAGLTQRDSKTIYSLLIQGGYTQDYFTAENLGFVRYHRGLGKISHRLKERMTIELSGSLERAEFDPNRTDWIWGIMGNASYQPLQWLTFSFEISHREDNSNVESSSFGENRALFRVTATY